MMPCQLSTADLFPDEKNKKPVNTSGKVYKWSKEGGKVSLILFHVTAVDIGDEVVTDDDDDGDDDKLV